MCEHDTREHDTRGIGKATKEQSRGAIYEPVATLHFLQAPADLDGFKGIIISSLLLSGPASPGAVPALAGYHGGPCTIP